MPSLFSRRRASSQPPRPIAPPSSSAAIAASNAFLQSSTSQASLSSAAAAAALRSHTTSPEPIGNIQTKRMMRRGSQSSLGNSGAVARPGAGRGMVRRDSNSSMTERTFRSPSPGRPDAVAQAPDAPPVPSIPKTIPGGQRRSASVEPAMRQSMTSPTPRRGGRNTSVDTGRNNVTSAALSAGQLAAAKAAVPRPSAGLERENSVGSVNFSRPMSPTAGVAPRPQSAAGWFSSPSVGTGSPRTSAADKHAPPPALSATQARQVERDIQNAANKPVLKKKKKAVEASEGERLSQGTMHSGPAGSAIQNTPSPAPQATSQTQTQTQTQTSSGDGTPVKQKKKAVMLDTNVTAGPPPKNPARFSPNREDARSPASASRAAGLLHKQPSVVREDPEAEDRAERQLPARAVSVSYTGRTIDTSEGPAIAYVAPGTERHHRAVSLDIPRDNGRTSSLSPQRNNVHAHFSDVIVVNSPSSRHQPPARSVSPFKSALKYSPSSSVRGSSPAAGPNGSKVPPSEGSDSNSLASQDGHKKKKAARVSFDDGGTTVSSSILATAATPNSSKPIRRELSPAAAVDSETDETMTPRPALPSFGSVRSRKTPSPERIEKVTETVPSSTSTSIATLPERSALSNDHIAGSVLANHFAEKTAARQSDPVPPVVTSIEGSAYESDSSSTSAERFTNASSGTSDVEHANPTESSIEASNKSFVATSPITATLKEDISGHPPVVPDISVQPATPGIEEDKPIFDSPGAAIKRPARYSVPGGWDDLEESKGESLVSSRLRSVATKEPDSESSDEEDGLAAPEIPAERHSPILEPIYESDSDNSDAFSDAAEDPSEFDGGFASLDAIVESPVQPPRSPFAVSTPPASPSTTLPPPIRPAFQSSPLSSSTPIPDDDGDWSHATAYWSSLTRERKEQMERQAQPVEEDTSVSPLPKPKKRAQPAAAAAIPLPETEPEEPPSKPSNLPRSTSAPLDSRYPPIKKTLRQSAEPARAPASVPASTPAGNPTHMRTSMRSGGGGGMRTSMRQEPSPRGSIDAEPRGALQKKRIPSAVSASSLGAATAAARKPPVAAAHAPLPPTDDSDSESSFKKQRRRASVSTFDSQGHYSMKRSMRGQSVDASAERRPTSPTPAPRGSGRFSVRSLSPNGSFMGRNKGENLRASLRGPVNDAPTMRGKNSKAARDSKSPNRFSMSGFSKARPSSAAGLPSSAPPASTVRPSRGFKSRFVDSDDEDDGAPSSGAGFRSRFADSDDESSPVGPPKRMPVNLAPVRGIPRRQPDDDSTDLDDSDEEVRPGGRTKKASGRISNKPIVPSEADIEAAMAAARRNVTAMNGGREPGVMPATNGTTNGAAATQVTIDPEPHINGVNGSIGPASPPTATPATPTKRRGFMGSMLGRRRTSSVASVPQIPSSYFASPVGSANQSPMPQGVQSPTGKLQRRSTKRTNSSMSALPQAPQSREGMVAEQQKAVTPGAASTNSQNWPFPQTSKINSDSEQRPATSDGVEMRRTMRGGDIVAREPRPELGRRSMSGGDLDRITRNQKPAVYSEKTGKKKRFGMLRNLFGLND